MYIGCSVCINRCLFVPMFVSMDACLSQCLCVWRFVCPSVCVNGCLFVSVFVYMCVFLSYVCPNVCLYGCLFDPMLVCMGVCRSIRPSVCQPVYCLLPTDMKWSNMRTQPLSHSIKVAIQSVYSSINQATFRRRFNWTSILWPMILSDSAALLDHCAL